MIDVTFANYFCYSLKSVMSYKNPPGEGYLFYAKHKLGLPKLKTKFLIKLLQGLYQVQTRFSPPGGNLQKSLEKNSL